jgi:transposase-like protein
MIEAGITNPIGQKGIDFCTQSCPYDYCVVVETPLSTKRAQHRLKVQLSQMYRKKRVSVADIALILGVDERTVRRYLKKSR